MRRSAEVNFTLAGRLPPVICVDVGACSVAFVGQSRWVALVEHRSVALAGGR